MSDEPQAESTQAPDPILAAATELSGEPSQQEASPEAAAAAVVAEAQAKEEAPEEVGDKEQVEADNETKAELSEESGEESEDKPKPFARSWEAIAKAEKKNREAASQLKEQREQFEQQQARLEELQSKFQNLDQDPVQFALQNLTTQQYEQLARKVIDTNGEALGRAGEPKQENPEIAELRQQIQQMQQSTQSAAVQKAVTDYKGQINQAIEGSDDLAILKTWPNAVDEVYAFAESYYSQTEEALTPADAAASIKETLVEAIKAVHQSKPDLIPGILGMQSPTEETKTPAPTATKTLGNDLTSQTASGGEENESEAEVMAKVAKMIGAQLNAESSSAI